uniref:Uncharacterized protein n=1 Tax=Anguilla anguilla TaxID=7936 RepID=A0A0E9W6W0_ANGAN
MLSTFFISFACNAYLKSVTHRHHQVLGIFTGVSHSARLVL